MTAWTNKNGLNRVKRSPQAGPSVNQAPESSIEERPLPKTPQNSTNPCQNSKYRASHHSTRTTQTSFPLLTSSATASSDDRAVFLCHPDLILKSTSLLQNPPFIAHQDTVSHPGYQHQYARRHQRNPTGPNLRHHPHHQATTIELAQPRSPASGRTTPKTPLITGYDN